MTQDHGPGGTTSPGEKKTRRRRGPVDSADCQIQVSRPAYTASQLRSDLHYAPPGELTFLKGAAKRLRSCGACSPGKLWALLLLRVPILAWLPRYKVKEYFAPDLIAGLTVGIMHLPQGMGYAMLAEVPPIVGLYTAFFPVITYIIFGTSRHISMGTFAVGCLMTGKIVVELSTPTPPANATNITDFAGAEDGTPHYTNIQVATAAAFMVGVWQLLFAILQLGKLSALLPEMLVSGFSMGCAVHVFSAQIKNLFGLKIKRHDGPFYLIFLYMDVFPMLASTNLTTLAMSTIGFLVLGTYNEVFKPRLRKVTNIPIPMDLFAIIIGTAVTHYCRLDKDHGVVVVGHIPRGLPPCVFPDHRLFMKMFLDSFVLAIIIYVICFSLAKIFCKRNGYKVVATQELYAGGFSNIFGSFFSVVPSCASLARSMVQETTGGKTQIVSAVSCCVVVVVLLFVGPYFESLPTSVLACIIVVALKGLFMHIYDFFAMWKLSKGDAMLWMVTFLTTVLVDVDIGVVAGVLFNVLLLLKRNNMPTVTRLGWVPKTDIYVDLDTYHSAVPVPGASLCYVSGALHSANIERFRDQLLKVTGLDTTLLFAAKLKREKREMKQQKKEALNNMLTDEGVTRIPHDTSEEGVDGTARGSPIRKPDQIVVIENISHNMRSQEIKEELANMFRRKNSSSYAFEDGQQAGYEKRYAEQGNENKAYLRDDALETNPDPNARQLGLVKRFPPTARGPTVPPQDVSFVVLCLSGVGWIDVSAAKDLRDLYTEHENAGIVLTLAAPNDSVMHMMTQCGVLDTIPEHRLFHTLHDAVTSLVADVLNSKPQSSPFVGGAKDGVKNFPLITHDARPAANSHTRRPQSGLPAPIQLRASHLEKFGMEGAADDFDYYQSPRNFAQPPQHREGKDSRNDERKRATNRGNNSHPPTSKRISQPGNSDYNTRF